MVHSLFKTITKTIRSIAIQWLIHVIHAKVLFVAFNKRWNDPCMEHFRPETRCFARIWRHFPPRRLHIIYCLIIWRFVFKKNVHKLQAEGGINFRIARLLNFQCSARKTNEYNICDETMRTIDRAGSIVDDYVSNGVDFEYAKHTRGSRVTLAEIVICCTHESGHIICVACAENESKEQKRRLGKYKHQKPHSSFARQFRRIKPARQINPSND